MPGLVRKGLIGLGAIGALLVVVIAVLAIHVARTWDKVWDAPLPTVKVSTDPAVLKRGEYLVYGPAHCVECHSGSAEEYARTGKGERIPLRGGLRFQMGPLGSIYSRNLTPDPETGIGRL